ncbi:hypothetical protein [Hymenobacter canadensis]|uniref:Lipoprotein n=1 Tax=Hymenobacter canadensis TaxID=2999067 RepID=A0ABY7LSH8_9BACT|nr:hypothetical protein [Hymenobacter canadensis]WBA42421.1 hypothetical protein O3303_02420 [Hymenobacter canadensis]
MLGCLAATAATAQTDCSAPVLQVLHNGQAIPATGSALPASAQMRLVPAPGCPAAGSYCATGAEVTLVRAGRPVLPIMLVPQSRLDLRPLQRIAQPGDHLFVFIPYENLLVVAADGSQRPYAKPTPKPGRLDLTPDDAKGISFKWLIVQPGLGAK